MKYFIILLSIIIYHYLSLSIIIYHYLSLSMDKIIEIYYYKLIDETIIDYNPIQFFHNLS